MKLGKLSIREQVVEAMNRVYRNALTTTSGGNLSAMDENGHIFITPSGIDKGRLSPEDIAEVLPDGTVIGKYAPSMELPFHSAIYAKCPDVKAVVHAHSPAVVAYACMRIAPDPRVADVFYDELGDIISSEYALPGSRELGNIIVGRFEEGYRTVMMDNHGATVGAADMAGALSKFETLDCLCKVLLNAPALGGTVQCVSAPKAQRPAYPVSRQDVADEKNAEEAAYFMHRAYRGGLAYGRTGTIAIRDGAGFIFNCAADRADGLQFGGVAGELQGIPAPQLGEQLPEAALIGDKGQALPGVHAEVIAAGTNQLVGPQTAQGNGFVAVGTGLLRLPRVLMDRGGGAAALFQLIFWF